MIAPVFSFYPHHMMVHDQARLEPYIQELHEYLNGERKAFDLPLDYDEFGTPIQRLVLDVVRRIPYGMTVTYTEIASAIRQVNSVRTVAHAVILNPMPIFIPCHRVVLNESCPGCKQFGADLKKKLLKLERSNMHAIS
ncbi:MAG: methylated-DNA--[protein]-cysteine S-methyltransferase [Lactobacillus sp.]|jgi:methylated-DNA-[protein]-cysteine S-methyltransferase|nr:methylated-DNA--[protein]-cysteine S-methyltransferase [Lactobacillus sp.]MCH3905729.1 methylated-DNA--[protein]-cysteine S-methyltransferase [Lactobacillus sp.]MCH3990702.1 methylated-DNA--[protein]-cysteine S-methyltransferase [Lactobacillus sp.]MCH4068582.1 methylated-DNA--[protein]-cysteine S-methyltransferase [Lactobacillus sp.]MCI1304123.1 methylated-DNA--[protein]-cysteine S-methyltransferase [Lactobacillus sp.]